MKTKAILFALGILISSFCLAADSKTIPKTREELLDRLPGTVWTTWHPDNNPISDGFLMFLKDGMVLRLDQDGALQSVDKWEAEGPTIIRIKLSDTNKDQFLLLDGGFYFFREIRPQRGAGHRLSKGAARKLFESFLVPKKKENGV